MAHVCPPTCVGLRYGSRRLSSRRFSRHHISDPCPAFADLAIIQRFMLTDLPISRPRTPEVSFQETRPVLQCVTPSKIYGSAGILTCCPSATPLGLALGPTNPGTIRVALETLGLRWNGFSPFLMLLMPTFSLPNAPRWLTPSASLQLECSLTNSRVRRLY